ncbi:g1466 [Coccomyxa elongata]
MQRTCVTASHQGKSVFSRAFIRAIADDQDLPVPSPTYLLQNTYEEHDGPLVHHFDLYRLSGPAELGRLQLEDAFNSGICLIEWAERLGSSAPADHLQVHIELLSEEDEERIRGMQGTRELIDQASSFQEEPADVDPEEGENAYCDKRWRRVVLIPKGIAWIKRIGNLAQALMDRPDQGLFLLSSLSQR